MSEYGINQFGFKRKPLDIIQKDIEQKARQLFGEDADLSVYSPIGLFSKMLSWKSNILWQELEKTYYGCWLDTAEGVNLDRIVAWGGLARKKAQKSVIQDQVFYGEQGTYIPMGIIVETPGGIQFTTISFGTIDSSGEVELQCEAVKTGSQGAVPENSVTVITDSIPGLESTTNKSGSIGAREEETDAELRSRYKVEGIEGAGSSIDAVRVAILAVNGVLDALVYENIEILPDSEGRPPKSIECVVLGGNEREIAEAIFETKSAGIETYGKDESIPISFQSQTYQINFSRLTSRYIHVAITIYANTSWDNEKNIADIQTNTIKYIGGIDTRTVNEEEVTTNYYGIQPGGDIYAWRIAAANKDISGIEDISIEIGFKHEIHGYQKISSQTDYFVPTNSPGLDGTYSIKVNIDNNGATDFTFDVIANNTWAEIVSKINDVLVEAKAVIEDNKIRISSDLIGTGSTISIADGDNNGFIIAVNALSGLNCTIEAAIAGVELTTNKLNAGIRDLARCENTNIHITVNQV